MGSQALQKPTSAGTRRPAVGNILGGVTCGQLCMTVSPGDCPFRRLRAPVWFWAPFSLRMMVRAQVLPCLRHLCTGSVTTMTLRFFFTPKHDPTHLGLVSTQRAAPWGFCALFPSSQGARAALVFFLSAGALPMLHPPGLCVPMFEEKAPRNTGWTSGWTPHPSSLLLKLTG